MNRFNSVWDRYVDNGMATRIVHDDRAGENDVMPDEERHDVGDDEGREVGSYRGEAPLETRHDSVRGRFSALPF